MSILEKLLHVLNLLFCFAKEQFLVISHRSNPKPEPFSSEPMHKHRADGRRTKPSGALPFSIFGAEWSKNTPIFVLLNRKSKNCSLLFVLHSRRSHNSPIFAHWTIWAKPSELGNYFGRRRVLIARRFWTVEFGRISVRNSPFEIFPRNLRSVSRNSHGWILRGQFIFWRAMSSNMISALNYLRFCDNFLGPSISYPRRRLTIFPRE